MSDINSIEEKLLKGIEEAYLVEKYEKFVKAVLRKFVGQKPWENLSSTEQREMAEFIKKSWPKYAKMHLKVETSSSGGVAGYSLPMGMKGPGKEQDKLAKEKGYIVSKPIEKRDPIYDEEYERNKIKESAFFGNKSLTPAQKVDLALSEIKQAMRQTEQLVRRTLKLQQENSHESSLYSETTKRSLKRISERAIRLISMLENIQ